MFNYILYRIGEFIALNLPLRLTYAIAAFASDLHYIFARQDRLAVRDNLRVIFPEKTESEIRKIHLRMSRNFSKYLADFFSYKKIDARYLKEKITIENSHYFDQALSKNKGVIVLSAHLGNWEMGAVVVAQAGYPLWEVALPHKFKKVDNFFNSQRERMGIKVIPVGKAARQCLDLLKNNQILALAGDRDFTEKGIVLDFFGRPTLFPIGPAAFSLKTGASIVPGFMMRNKDDTFTLKIEKPLEFNPTGEKDRDLKEIISKYKVIFEDYILRYPDQWYMFKRFWKE